MRAKNRKLKANPLNYDYVFTPIFVVDSVSGVIIVANSSCEDLLGYPKGQLLGLPLKDLIEPKDQRRVLTPFDRSIRLEVLREFEVTMVRKSGRRIIINLFYHFRHEESHVVISAQDITDLKAAYSRLANSRDYAQKIVDSLSEILMVLNPQGIIKTINTAGLSLLGYESAQIVDHPLTDFIAAQDLTLPRLFRKPQDRIDLKNHPVDLLTSDQKILSTLVSGVSIANDSAESYNIILVFTDISKLREAQRERERALALVAQSSKMASVGQLSAGVAHELNNPLAIIQGYVENLELLANQQNHQAAQIRAQLHPITHAIERMSRIIDNMKTLSGQDPKTYRNCKLSDLVKNAIYFLNDQLRSKQIEISLKVSALVFVYCDPLQIEQIINNIVSNAIFAFTPESHDRQIRIETIAPTTGSETHLKIWNNGPPIPPEVQDRMFDPFFTTRRIGDGVGLGLSIAYEIMKSHGGRVSCSSSAGQGTEFDLIFPTVIKSGSAAAA